VYQQFYSNFSELATKLRLCIDKAKDLDLKEKYNLMQEFFNTEIAATMRHF